MYEIGLLSVFEWIALLIIQLNRKIDYISAFPEFYRWTVIIFWNVSVTVPGMFLYNVATAAL